MSSHPPTTTPLAAVLVAAILTAAIAHAGARPRRRRPAAGRATPRSAAPCCRPTTYVPTARRRAPHRRHRHHRRVADGVINGIQFPTPVAAGRGLLGDRRGSPARRVPGDGRQRLRQQGELGRLPHPGLLRCDRTSRRRDGGTGAVARRRLHRVQRPVAADRLPDHERWTGRPRPDRRRHRPRVAPARPTTATSGSATSSARGSCTSTPRAACWRRRIALPDGLVAATNPAATRPGRPAPGDRRQQPRHRGDGDDAQRALPLRRSSRARCRGDPLGVAPDLRVRRRHRRFTGERFAFLADVDTDGVDRHFVSDAQAVDRHRLRRSSSATAPTASAVPQGVRDRPARRAPPTATCAKTLVVDLAAIPDPDGVSLPAIHPGDVGLGDPFRVMCESVEALRIVRHDRGCCSAATTTSRTSVATPASPTTTS